MKVPTKFCFLVVLLCSSLLCAVTVVVNPGDDVKAKAATCKHGDILHFNSGVTVTNIDLLTPGVFCELNDGGQFTITNNKFGNVAGNALYIGAGMHDSKITNNQFANVMPSASGAFCGIYGYPGNNNVLNNNSFDNVYEAVHLISACDNLDVSFNTITRATRIGIELQTGMTHLRVVYNNISNWLNHPDKNGVSSHMAISCATGGNGTAPFANQGAHIEIGNNNLLHTGADANQLGIPMSAIEIMGGTNISVHDNYCLNWGVGLLNGVTNNALTSANNTFICTLEYANDFCPWPITALKISGDKFITPGSANIPSVPNGTPSAPPVVTPTPTGVLATATAQGEMLTWVSATGTTYSLSRLTVGNGVVVQMGTVTSPYVDTAAAVPWVYQYSLSAMVAGQATSVPSTTTAQYIPPVSPAQPTSPVIMPVYIGHSRDQQIWTTDGTVQP